MTTIAEVTTVEKRILTATDRCDRCGAQAYLAAQFPHKDGSGELLFCAHHATEHMPKIIGNVVVDQLGELTREKS